MKLILSVAMLSIVFTTFSVYADQECAAAAGIYAKTCGCQPYNDTTSYPTLTILDTAGNLKYWHLNYGSNMNNQDCEAYIKASLFCK